MVFVFNLFGPIFFISKSWQHITGFSYVQKVVVSYNVKENE